MPDSRRKFDPLDTLIVELRFRCVGRSRRYGRRHRTGRQRRSGCPSAVMRLSWIAPISRVTGGACSRICRGDRAFGHTRPVRWQSQGVGVDIRWCRGWTAGAASDQCFSSSRPNSGCCERSVRVTYSPDTCHDPGGTEELRIALRRFAPFGDWLAARLVPRRIASSARIHGQTCWQSPSSGAARSSAQLTGHWRTARGG
ncbi:MAG: hypothetical protein QOF66_5301 [Mycobacterium sp.]|nr:hypothetical protein [Mycobacterium sp.]